LAAFHAREDSNLSGLQGDCGLVVLAVGHADGSLMTMHGLKHLVDVCTFPSGGIGMPPGLTSIIPNEQQRLTLFDAELSQGTVPSTRAARM
jgi:hypothetical protein